MARRVQKKRTSPLVRVLKVLYIMLVIVSVIIVGTFAAYQVFIGPPDVEDQVTFPITSPQPSQDVTASQEPETTPSDDVVVYTRREGVYTCLLTGSDEGNLRADTIMLGCFDTNNKTATLVSIPRDTLVLRNGKNSKINAVYGNGKGEAMAQAVSELLGVPVDYYVSVDLDAFGAIVKAIGGVYFDVPIDMNYDDPYQDLHIHLEKGYQKLNAEQAIGGSASATTTTVPAIPGRTWTGRKPSGTSWPPWSARPLPCPTSPRSRNSSIFSMNMWTPICR
mgnify:CR=1 FL=1